MKATVSRVDAACGAIDVYVVDGRLVALGFDSQAGSLRGRLRARFGALDWEGGETPQAAVVRRYLTGELGALAALEVDPGGTPFQRGVWSALRQIPVGETVSYGELARAIGRPSAVRAVARANALNPISLVIPCHRVIGAHGALTGYAGGLPRKEWLLAHESRRSWGPATGSVSSEGLSATGSLRAAWQTPRPPPSPPSKE